VAVDPERAEERPTTFAGKPGVVYAILKRVPGAELPDAPKGTFTIKTLGDGAAWVMSLDGIGKFKMTRNGQLGVEGTYRIEKDQIEFTDEAGPFRETGKAQIGTYRWRLAGSKLLFQQVHDEARGRSAILLSGAWDAKKD